MDWARDNAVLAEKDLKNVFSYEEKPTTVLRMLANDEEPLIWSLEGKNEWNEWLNDELPRIDSSASGLVLILAKRTGEPVFPRVKKIHSDDWLESVDNEMTNKKSSSQKGLTITALSEKGPVTGSGGQRSIKTLPFSRETFLRIAREFHIHNSTVRVISRSDIPVFSSAEVQMDDGAQSTTTCYVYNCRTTNSWAMDLALTVTHFPQSGLSFAILFGCPISVEKKIIERLALAKTEAAHPLLMPGIFAEFERSRHVHIIEELIDEIETRILSLDIRSEDMEGIPAIEQETKNREKRTQWLDTTYLRNQLISWNTQLTKIVKHADELERTIYRHNKGEESTEVENLSETEKTHTRRVGVKIRDRVQEIIDEYDDKVRDCTMRIDGMAMATQWAQGETNVDIALATSRDSRHMRSIALVTMVFLPGTFFASLFSMTFFNWNDSDGGGMVSSYLWIYIVITVFFTLLTVGSWWYFVIYRQRRLHTPAVDVEA